MSTLKTTNLQNASAASPAFVLASDGSATANLSSLNGGPIAGSRNRIINGDMRIDQRNAGASVTPTTNGTYNTVDRWKQLLSQSSKYSVQQNAGSVTPPAGFGNYLGCTSTSAYSVLAGDYFLLEHDIEGFNFADLDWGTANAKTITLSFWVRSSLTGTFGGALQNSAENRSYPISYTISAANTWEFKTLTVAGDTSGTWIGATNGVGLRLRFGLGVGSTYSGTSGSWSGSTFFSATGATSVVGTNGATFYITGVQLEPGTVATPFERRSHSIEQLLCFRYYHTNVEIGTLPNKGGGSYSEAVVATVVNTGTSQATMYRFPVPMRAAPTITIWSPNNGAAGQAWSEITQTNVSYTSVANAKQFGLTSSHPTGGGISSNAYYYHYAASAEL
jgi:hypothetical protein